jgi:hypothetical protein
MGRRFYRGLRISCPNWLAEVLDLEDYLEPADIAAIMPDDHRSDR